MINRDHIEERANYWLWFTKGTSSGPGWKGLIIERWVLAHIAIGIGLAVACDTNLKDSATTALLPLAGVLIGITFAWATNVQSLLQSKTWVTTIEEYTGKGVEDSVFEYLNSILLMILTIGIWGMSALGLFERLNLPPEPEKIAFYKGIAAFVYFATSYSVHHCWKVVSMAQMSLVAVLLLEKQESETEIARTGAFAAIAEQRKRLEEIERQQEPKASATRRRR